MEQSQSTFEHDTSRLLFATGLAPEGPVASQLRIQGQSDELDRLRADRQELLRLRGEVGQHKETVRSMATAAKIASTNIVQTDTNSIVAELYRRAAAGESEALLRLVDYGSFGVGECEVWIKKALVLDDKAVQRQAIDDLDLKPLWDSMGGTVWKRTE